MTFDGVAGVMAGSVIGSGATTATVDAHTLIRGFEIGWKGLPVKVKTYVWNRVMQATNASGTPATAASSGGKNDNLYVYGVKLRGEAAGGWFNLDLAKNAGECRDEARSGALAGSTFCNAGSGSSNYTGHAALLELGFNGDMANVGGIAPWASFGWGSGRSDSRTGTNDAFQAIGSDWRPGLINRRFNTAGTGGSDVLSYRTAAGAATNVHTTGLSDRVVWGLGTNFTPASVDQLTVGAQLWDFRLQRNDNATNTIGTAAAQGTSGNKHIGTELDLTANWRHSENVSLAAGWARFWTGGAIKELNRSGQGATPRGDSPATFIHTDISIKF
jgi:hypothetical protein